MIPTSAILILSGIVCLILSGFMVRRLRPQEGVEPSFWTKTEFRATSVALGLVSLIALGGGLMLKGIFG